MTRLENSRTWNQQPMGPDRLTSVLGILIGLLTALAANLMLH
jgi:hypothetical protein